jgi:hypothetical protein
VFFAMNSVLTDLLGTSIQCLFRLFGHSCLLMMREVSSYLVFHANILISFKTFTSIVYVNDTALLTRVVLCLMFPYYVQYIRIYWLI